jgi:hypothetical protein
MYRKNFISRTRILYLNMQGSVATFIAPYRRIKSTMAVLRIRDILVRIRIRGSVPLTNRSESDSGSCYFRH